MEDAKFARIFAPDMEQKRILVVDDERDLCDILLFNLHAAGYQAEAAYSAEEALRKMEEWENGRMKADLLPLNSLSRCNEQP